MHVPIAHKAKCYDHARNAGKRKLARELDFHTAIERLQLHLLTFQICVVEPNFLSITQSFQTSSLKQQTAKKAF